ncbi:5'/3'-nucleotidase SurE [Opitutus sp. ER46]|uniref:5'/3'-nucleotidase SurE n=1 Tax=Opitutus sp. ER46 TaxID=2161864 RepID=UPI000D31CF0D|nr:5'/3'-nucleotidase SurE [Opitutus sp. ER46]PTX92346.1 5'/3'-nucleotidase SurE [Opitutus sp. ER46]
MRILISNDDGIYSPGLAALARMASAYGEVRIVAPDVEQSSKSHSITSSRPLNIRRTQVPLLDGFEAYRVDGTPADCVALGVSRWGKPDLVLSGVNLGPNLGNGIWHSGTLAAAKQAALHGVRGIAFSTPVPDDEPKFDRVMPWARKALEILLPHAQLPLVNVNIPENARGLAWTCQSFRHYDGYVVPGTDPLGRQHYWFSVRPIEEVEPGSDRWAVENHFVSLTPLRLDLTDEARLEEVEKLTPLDASCAASETAR